MNEKTRCCRFCGKNFVSSHYSKSFCTEQCKIRHFSLKRALDKPGKGLRDCLWCGQQFIPRRSGRDQTYCSVQCRRQYIHTVKSQWSPKEMRTREICDSKKELVIGSLLGDGSIIRQEKILIEESNCAFSMTQGHKQREYLLWKIRQMHPLIHTEHLVDSNYNGTTVHVKRSICHPYFDYMHKVFYVDKKKIIPRNIIDSISPKSLAIWYMDDGSFLRHKNSRQAVLCTDGFRRECVEYAANSLRCRFGLDTRIYSWTPKASYGKGTYNRIYILRASVPRLFDIVREYIHPTMVYKITG